MQCFCAIYLINAKTQRDCLLQSNINQIITVIVNPPGPAALVSMKLLISLPTVPMPRPSPEQITLLASHTAVTVTLRGQPLTCLDSKKMYYLKLRVKYPIYNLKIQSDFS